MVAGWAYFIWSGSVETIWPMFGVANQLLALIALCVVTTVMINSGRARYAPVTLAPMLFVACTTLTAAYSEMTGKYLGWACDGATRLKGVLNLGLTVVLVGCVAVIVVAAVGRWLAVLRKPSAAAGGEAVPAEV